VIARLEESMMKSITRLHVTAITAVYTLGNFIFIRWGGLDYDLAENKVEIGNSSS
jgi:hypothetical protein